MTGALEFWALVVVVILFKVLLRIRERRILRDASAWEWYWVYHVADPDIEPADPEAEHREAWRESAARANELSRNLLKGHRHG